MDGKVGTAHTVAEVESDIRNLYVRYTKSGRV